MREKLAYNNLWGSEGSFPGDAGAKREMQKTKLKERNS
jgi:hypothetical protein